jgi:hypothetical protein
MINGWSRWLFYLQWWSIFFMEQVGALKCGQLPETRKPM